MLILLVYGLFLLYLPPYLLGRITYWGLQRLLPCPSIRRNHVLIWAFFAYPALYLFFLFTHVKHMNTFVLYGSGFAPAIAVVMAYLLRRNASQGGT